MILNQGYILVNRCRKVGDLLRNKKIAQEVWDKERATASKSAGLPHAELLYEEFNSNIQSTYPSSSSASVLEMIDQLAIKLTSLTDIFRNGS